MKGIKQKDLIPILGTKGNVSKILSGAAKIQLEMLDPLAQFLGIPVEALIPKRSAGVANRMSGSMTQTAVAEPSIRYRKHKS
jgi:transcriptional regulator with XRE-family HTH domain